VGEPVNPSVNPPGIDPAQAQHPGRRDSQQDACGFSNLADEAFAAHGGHLAVLADGMGGMRNGLWAASHAVQAFIQAYQAKTADETIHAALQRALSAANAVVHDEAQRLNAVDRMGTTLAVAVVRGLDLHWLNVGDSRVYLVEDGHLMCLSTDHSYAEILRLRVHRGELSAGEALGHPLRHALTSYLGRPEPVQHASSGAAVQLRPGARVLLCSDGLTQALDDEQICSLLQGSAQDACDRLLQAALARDLPDQDNTTAVMLHVPRPGQAPDAGGVSRAFYDPDHEAGTRRHSTQPVGHPRGCPCRLPLCPHRGGTRCGGPVPPPRWARWRCCGWRGPCRRPHPRHLRPGAAARRSTCWQHRLRPPGRHRAGPPLDSV
jgi:serine/threonine protein phosphatase PrpC